MADEVEVVDNPEIYIGDTKLEDLDWKTDRDPEDFLDDPSDKPASKELIALLGFDPDEKDEPVKDRKVKLKRRSK